MRSGIGLVVILGLGALLCRAQNFSYYSLTYEEPVYSGQPVIAFTTGDTIHGSVHSNGQIAITGAPVFYGQVTTSAADFWRGEGYAPEFHAGPPRVSVPPVTPSMETAARLRASAAAQGNFYTYPGYQFRIIFYSSTAHVYRWPRGVPFDSTNNWPITITQRTCLFFEGVVQVKGVVQGRVTVGSSQRIDILDNITVAGADARGRVNADNRNFIGLVSEGDIKIYNTPENGRENSGMPNDTSGRLQSDPSRTSVVITASLLALGGSVTFEQQNDPDSGYVCDCTPDHRGTIYLWGGLVQQRRGYLQRHFNGGTGYLLMHGYDIRLLFSLPPCFFGSAAPPITADPDTINFGNVPVGTTVWDTTIVTTAFANNLGAVYANHPFLAQRIPPFYGNRFAIPVRFTPPGVGNFSGILYVSAGPEHVTVILRGRGIPRPGPLALEIAPNPFNLTTTIRFALPEAGDVDLILYDVLGRAARDIRLPHAAAGEHAVALHGDNLASGVYFLQLRTANQVSTNKLLLIK